MKDIRKPNIMTPVMEERVVLVAYGEGSLLDRIMVHYVRKRNPRVQAALESHEKTITLARNAMSEIYCPDRVFNRLQAYTSEHVRRSTSFHWGIFNRLAAGGVVALALIMAVTMFSPQSTSPSRDALELELATEQARASMALVSSIFAETSRTLREEAILEHTSRPIVDSIYKGSQTIKRNL